MIRVKKLKTSDFLQYKKIRLEMLERYPMYFGSSVFEETLFSDTTWMNRLNKVSAKTIGLFDDQKIVGIVVLMFNQRSKMKHFATIYSMYIKDEYQGKGYSKMLLEHAFLEAIENDVEKLRLSVVHSNEGAISLYNKIGFKPYAVEKGTIKYKDKYYDLLLMEKEMGVKNE